MKVRAVSCHCDWFIFQIYIVGWLMNWNYDGFGIRGLIGGFIAKKTKAHNFALFWSRQSVHQLWMIDFFEHHHFVSSMSIVSCSCHDNVEGLKWLIVSRILMATRCLFIDETVFIFGWYSSRTWKKPRHPVEAFLYSFKSITFVLPQHLAVLYCYNFCFLETSCFCIS